jgi:hypothetical protein
MNGSTDPLAMVQRLLDATNAHDIDGIVSCFSDDYVNETPVHPARGFYGTEQVRRNWTQLLDGIPDLKASVLARAANSDTAWTEWEISGVRRDGAVHIMRGVIIFGVRHGKAAWAKFYLEPVEQSSGDVNAAVARASGAIPPGSAPS